MKKIHLSLLLAAACLASQVSAQTLSNYQFTVSSQGPTTYFKLDNSTASSVDPSVTLESFGVGGYLSDVYRNSTNAYFYVNSTDFLRNLTTNLISGGGATNTSSTASGSITFLFRTLTAATNTGQRYLFYAGNTTADGNALSLFFENDNVTNGNPNSLKLRFGDSTSVIMEASNILAGTWYYFGLTYLESRTPNKAIWYLGQAGGTLTSGTTTNADFAVAGDGSATLVVGNQTNYNSAFRNPGNGRIDEFAIWNRELSTTEISNQFSKLPQLPPANATYQQVVTAQIPAHYFKLDGSFADSVNGALSLSTNSGAGAFSSNVLGNASAAYSLIETNDALFTTTDIINGGGANANTSATGTGTISFLFRMLSDTNNAGQRYLMSQGGVSGTLNQFALFLENTNISNGDPNSLKIRMGNGPTTTIRQPADLATNAWYYFAMTYDESRNSNPGEIKWYLGPVGGVLTNGAVDIGNTAVIGDNGWFVIGNRTVTNIIQNNAFRGPGSGAVDEFATWNDELTAAEITAQFNAVTNTAAVGVPAPSLSILRSASDAILSWPSATSPSYALEATATLTSPSWTNAGSPSVVGDNNVVTNSLTAGAKFYRLHKF